MLHVWRCLLDLTHMQFSNTTNSSWSLDVFKVGLPWVLLVLRQILSWNGVAYSIFTDSLVAD